MQNVVETPTTESADGHARADSGGVASQVGLPSGSLLKSERDTRGITFVGVPLVSVSVPEYPPTMLCKIVRALLIAIACCLVSSSSSAQYEQIHHTRSVPLQATNWSTNVDVPRFDPDFGDLVDVAVVIEGTVRASAGVESLDGAPSLVSVTRSGNLTLTLPVSGNVVASPTIFDQVAFTAYDGTLDFGGTSGITYPATTFFASEGSTVPMLPANLPAFVGPPGAPGTVSLAVTGQGVSIATGSGNLVTQFTTQAGAIVRVSYTYDSSRGVRVQKRGTSPVPGRTVDYCITVRNTGFATVTNLDVLESVDPRYFQLVDVNPPALLDTTTSTRLGLVAWRIPSISAGQTQILTYRAVLDPQTALGTVVPGGPVWAGYGLPGSWVDCFDIVQNQSPDCGCFAACCTAPCSADPLQCLICRANCAAQTCPGQGQACLRATRDVAVACFDASANIVSRWVDAATVVGPFDPNEKRVVNPQYIQPNEGLTYSVHYENLGTLPAIDVRIVDDLDTDLDISTLQVTASPGAQVSVVGRVVTIDLQGINLQPGQSGNAYLLVAPSSGLSPGTPIINSANIQFEQQPPLQTNSVLNQIDGVRPTGTMNTLAPQVAAEDFLISWGGSDPVGVTLDFTVYVSRDSGDYQVFLRETTGTSATFTGQAGSRYDFYCIARDSAGNVELQAPLAEASTTVTMTAPSFCAGDGASIPCPCGNASALGAGEGCASSLGHGGTLRLSGTSSVALGNLVLEGAGMLDGPALYFQGTTAVNGGLGALFGDGLRCAGGTVVRLATKMNALGGSRYPEAGDPPVAVRGYNVPGAQRVYQCWYRNSAPFCTPETFNTTNARRLTWSL